MGKWMVYDWAGNDVLKGMTFDSFEDAWGYLYALFPDEENFEDYYVEMRQAKERRYLDPRDPRMV